MTPPHKLTPSGNVPWQSMVMDSIPEVVEPQADSVAAAPADSAFSALWEPASLQNDGANETPSSLFYILLMGFVGGLLAVLMPCIWPIIPMTVSLRLIRRKVSVMRLHMV